MTRKYQLGSPVRKKGLKGQWRGWVVGFYQAKHTPIGYAVESALEPGSVQIYPEDSLEDWDGGRNDGSGESYLENLYHRTSAKVSHMEIEHKRRVNELLESNNVLLERARKAEALLKRLVDHDRAADKREGLPYHCIELEDAIEHYKEILCPAAALPVKTYEDGYLDGYKQGVKDGCELMRDCKKIVTDTIAR